MGHNFKNKQHSQYSPFNYCDTFVISEKCVLLKYKYMKCFDVDGAFIKKTHKKNR